MILLALYLSLFAPMASISWDTMVHNFGSLSRDSDKLNCEFTFTNNSDRAVRVAYAVASCSCTKVDWTREPVVPGSNGTVSVTYFRERNADSFDKSVSVFFEGSPKPYVLVFMGKFYDTSQTLASEFPYRRSSLGLQDDPGDFDVVHPGQAAYMNMWLSNFSSETISVRLDSLSDGLTVSPARLSISGGSRASLMCTLMPDSLTWGRRSYSFVPVVNGESQRPVEYWATVLPDFSSLSPSEKNASAYFKVLGEVHHFGVIRQGDSANLRIGLQNVSSKDFSLMDVRADRDGVAVSAPASVPAGQRADIDISIDPSVLEPGNNSFIISIVTDSPLKPFTQIEVLGYVEKQ